jgi:hypothetical protein
MVITNMRVLKKSRKRPRPGDVFALQIQDGQFFFGRVVRLDASIFWMENCVLIYVYKAASEDKHRVPHLSKTELLVPPILTNFLPWSKGYFETVEHRPLEEEDVLEIHCFWSCASRGYYDEYSNRLPGRLEPCGEHGLDSYRTIDDKISRAQGIPLAPEDDEIPDVGERELAVMLSSGDLEGTGLDSRDVIEDALDAALSKSDLGQVSGGGTGATYSCIEIALTDKATLEEAVAVARSALARLGLPNTVRIILPGGIVRTLRD